MNLGKKPVAEDDGPPSMPVGVTPFEIMENSLPAEEANESATSVSKLHYALMGVFIFLCFFSLEGKTQISGQYIYFRFKEKVGLSSNVSESTCYANKSDPNFVLQNEAQELAANIDFLNSVFMLPRFITVLFLASYSDDIGRKWSIIIPWIGMSVEIIIQDLFVALDLPMFVFLLSQIPTNLSGGYVAVLSGLFSFVADSTKLQQRSVALVAVDLSVFTSMVTSSLVTGWLIAFLQYKIPFLLMSGLLIVSGLCVFFLPETSQKCLQKKANKNQIKAYNPTKTQEEKEESLTPWKVIQNISKLFTADWPRAQFLILLYSIAFLFILINFGGLSMNTLYLMNQPFCWTSVSLGYYSAISLLLNCVGTFGLISVARRCFRDEAWLILIGLLSLMSACIVMGVSSLFPSPIFNYTIYLGLVLGMFASVCLSMMRSILSKLVTKYEIGVVLGTFGSLESLGVPLGGLMTSAVYKATVSQQSGAYKFFHSGVVAFTMILAIIFIWKRKRALKKTSQIMEVQ